MKGLTAALMILAGTATGLFAEESDVELAPEWEYVADTVMGGVSTGKVRITQIDGREATQLMGEVSLDNNGGFIQMAFDMAQGDTFDAAAWRGIEIDVYGNGQTYELRLRTDQLQRPWQSYRTEIAAPADWQTLRLPWSAFEAHRTDVPFDPARLRRIGLLAIGSQMQADVAVSSIRLYP